MFAIAWFLQMVDFHPLFWLIKKTSIFQGNSPKLLYAASGKQQQQQKSHKEFN